MSAIYWNKPKYGNEVYMQALAAARSKEAAGAADSKKEAEVRRAFWGEMNQCLSANHPWTSDVNQCLLPKALMGKEGGVDSAIEAGSLKCRRCRAKNLTEEKMSHFALCNKSVLKAAGKHTRVTKDDRDNGPRLLQALHLVEEQMKAHHDGRCLVVLLAAGFPLLFTHGLCFCVCRHEEQNGSC